MMTNEEIIYGSAAVANISLKGIAETLGLTYSQLRKRILRNTVSPELMADIAEAMQGEYINYFIVGDKNIMVGNTGESTQKRKTRRSLHPRQKAKKAAEKQG